MATGIVAVALHADGQAAPSAVMFGLTAVGWCLLGLVFVFRFCFERERWSDEAAGPTAFTAVPATAVLGVWLTVLGVGAAGWALLALAAGLYAALFAVWARCHVMPATGGAFLLVVAPQSLAVLLAVLAARLRLEWPALIALAPLVLGLALYLRVLVRFDFRHLRTGAGDQWVAGGALAISALACAGIAAALSRTYGSGPLYQWLRTAASVVWALAVVWLALLIATELRWRRTQYDVRRWATVFPLGMYAVMSFAVGRLASAHGVIVFAEVFVWVALSAWVLAAAGLIGRLPHPHGRPPIGEEQVGMATIQSDNRSRRSTPTRSGGTAMVMTSNQHVLVIANVTAMSDVLLETLQERAEHGPAAFTLILPATLDGGGRTGAHERLEAALERLRSEGLTVEGQVADCDPVWAVREAWDPRRYDEIILCTLPMRMSKWLHAGLPQRIAELTGACVTHVVAEPPKAPEHVDHVIAGGQTVAGPWAPLHALEALWQSSSRPSQRV